MGYRKIAVIGTALVFLALLGGLVVYEDIRVPDRVALNTSDHPAVGNSKAKVEVVLFEDFRCPHCKTFNETIFPKIQEQYIASDQARFVIVPVAFIPGSKPIANAVIEVYRSSPDRLLLFIDELFQLEGPIDQQTLLQLARKVGKIDLAHLQGCLERRCHYDEVDANLDWGHALEGKDFGTPALFINGISTSTDSFGLIKARIDQNLETGKTL